MSRSVGPYTADPCPRRSTEAVRSGFPTTEGGRAVVGYLCDHCAHPWTRPVEDDLEVYDTVRVVSGTGTGWNLRRKSQGIILDPVRRIEATR